ncbi:MAG: hypothetical protein V7L25_17230 [Nostoc sp.]|uniref:hypothetical protein n=1 Tax=Nostoc sp. TaxID=1180 RepID=UPI002FEF691B
MNSQSGLITELTYVVRVREASRREAQRKRNKQALLQKDSRRLRSTEFFSRNQIELLWLNYIYDIFQRDRLRRKSG